MDNIQSGKTAGTVGSAGIPVLPTFSRVLLHIVEWLRGRKIKAVYGLERIEALCSRNQAVIFAIRHPGLMDTVLIACLLMRALRFRTVSFMIDWMYVRAPLLKGILAPTGPIEIWRKKARWKWLQTRKPSEQPDPLAIAAQRLKAGTCVGVFPEGRMAHSASEFSRLRSGTAHLAMTTASLVIPIGIEWVGSNPRKHKVDGFIVRIGPAISPDATARPESPEWRYAERLFTERLDREMRTLSGIPERAVGT